MSKQVYAWHFLAEDGRLGYDDNRKVKQGKKMGWLKYGKKPSKKEQPETCIQGMHASIKVMDAARFHTGRPILTRVVLEGRMSKESTKIAADYRTAIAGFDTRDPKFMKAVADIAENHNLHRSPGNYDSGAEMISSLRFAILGNKSAKNAIRKLCMRWCKLARNG